MHQLGSGEQGHSATEFRYPDGVTVRGQHVFVVDTSNHRICRMSLDADRSKFSSFGSEGFKVEQFYFPTALCLYADGKELFVSDTYNHRIVVLNPHRWLRSWGSE